MFCFFTMLPAPQGCLQYYTGLTGSVASFNYANRRHLAGLNYDACIRQEKGMCSILWSVSNNNNNNNNNNKTTTTTTLAVVASALISSIPLF